MRLFTVFSHSFADKNLLRMFPGPPLTWEHRQARGFPAPLQFPERQLCLGDVAVWESKGGAAAREPEPPWPGLAMHPCRGPAEDELRPQRLGVHSGGKMESRYAKVTPEQMTQVSFRGESCLMQRWSAVPWNCITELYIF